MQSAKQDLIDLLMAHYSWTIWSYMLGQINWDSYHYWMEEKRVAQKSKPLSNITL